MSIADYEKAKAIIAANGDTGRFAGSKPEELVKKAEDMLGVRFPPTYRQFLLDYGAGNFGSADEFYGVIDEDFENSSVPDGVWFTLTERRDAGLPGDLIVVGDTGMGELYCLNLAAKEGPVVVIDPGFDMAVREEVAPDFGTFLLQRVQQASG